MLERMQAVVQRDGGTPGLRSIRRAWATTLRAEPAVLIRGSASSELFSCGPAPCPCCSTAMT